jgi:hypothetical protein
MKWERHVAHMGEKRNTCKVFVGKSGRKRPLGWEENVLKLLLRKLDDLCGQDPSGSG